MNNADFWASINSIIDEGYTRQGLQQLDRYAEQFINHRLVYQRFSPLEQHGCIEGGTTHVIASLLAAAKTGTNQTTQCEFSNFEEERECAAQQARCIEQWARATGCWIDNVINSLTHDLGEHIAEGGEAVVFDNGASLIKSIGLDYYIQPLLALDRISLHNAFFPATRLRVLGFGQDTDGDFMIIVEQPFIIGHPIQEDDITKYLTRLGFKLINPRNWTYATPEIYLSDVHDENVIESDDGTILVIDCDIRINTPDLNMGGIRKALKLIQFIDNGDYSLSHNDISTTMEPQSVYGTQNIKDVIVASIINEKDEMRLKQIWQYLHSMQ